MWTNLKSKLKNLHKSATIWFNGAGVVVIMSLPQAQDSFPQLQGYIPEKFYHYGMGVLILGNILLRFKTNKALQDK